MDGTWDCANPSCARYHEVFRRPFRDYAPGPPCPGCHQRLRLMRVIRTMDPAVKERLHRLAAEKRAVPS